MEMFRVIHGGVDFKAKEDGGVIVHPGRSKAYRKFWRWDQVYSGTSESCLAKSKMFTMD